VLIAWSKIVEIGHPVVDAEHRYLTQLINNFFDQYEAGKGHVDLSRLFTHLTKYIRVHFRNEEALMQAVDYPYFEPHRKLHERLVKQCMELSEEYLDGEEAAPEHMFAFLKEWWVGHISESDTTIQPYVDKTAPVVLDVTPAFAGDGDHGPEFKKCTMCGKVWHSFEELAADPDKIVKGCQIDLTNHLYNLIMFNCSCNTTLAMFVSELVPQTDIPFVITNNGPSVVPSYCMKENKNEPCLDKCACSYTRQVLEALG